MFDLRPGTKYGIKLLVTSTTNKKYSSHTITQMTEEINICKYIFINKRVCVCVCVCGCMHVCIYVYIYV